MFSNAAGDRVSVDDEHQVGRPNNTSGMRQSAHNQWPDIQEDPEEWSYQAGEFFEHLFSDCERRNVRLVAETPKGKRIKEVFVEGEQGKITQAILDLQPVENKILFDPIPYSKGVQEEWTRNGWATFVNCHPARCFPPVAIYWQVGVNVYQGITPLNAQVSNEMACIYSAREDRKQAGVSVSSEINDLLVVPGSFIHLPGLPSYPARVQYDAFMFCTFDEEKTVWTMS